MSSLKINFNCLLQSFNKMNALNINHYYNNMILLDNLFFKCKKLDLLKIEIYLLTDGMHLALPFVESTRKLS